MLSEQQTPIARFIEEHANRSPYSYKEIALLCGFNTSDMIYCFMRGERKVPFDMVAPLAEVLGCDSGHLFVLAFKSWFSDDYFNQLQEGFSSMEQSKAERGWILGLREAYKGRVPEFTDDMKARLKEIVEAAS